MAYGLTRDQPAGGTSKATTEAMSTDPPRCLVMTSAATLSIPEKVTYAVGGPPGANPRSNGHAYVPDGNGPTHPKANDRIVMLSIGYLKADNAALTATSSAGQ